MTQHFLNISMFISLFIRIYIAIFNLIHKLSLELYYLLNDATFVIFCNLYLFKFVKYY